MGEGKKGKEERENGSAALAGSGRDGNGEGRRGRWSSRIDVLSSSQSVSLPLRLDDLDVGVLFSVESVTKKEREGGNERGVVETETREGGREERSQLREPDVCSSSELWTNSGRAKEGGDEKMNPDVPLILTVLPTPTLVLQALHLSQPVDATRSFAARLMRLVPVCLRAIQEKRRVV